MDLFKILGTIAVDNAEAKKALRETTSEAKKTAETIDETGESGNSAGGKLGAVFGGIGKAAVACGKVVVTGLAAGAGAVSALVTTSIKSYAEYEQLVGGSKLLFGDAYDYIADKAKNAYSTVQMSQNEYLEQANGFATGLKTALGGNEQAAAELADKIINAEADIVAATGNTQENVQNAFNGIMKSNFTMLDNLQIGITPTKEGFQEVIDKVNEWNTASGNATSYQIDNLADCQSALVDYIEMQGLAGYAADEAAGTISGSVAMMKSSWQNLLTAISADDLPFEDYVNSFVESTATVVDNLIPRIGTALEGVVSLIDKLAPILAAKIPELVSQLLPMLISSATSLINSLVAALPGLVDSLVTSALPMLISGIVTIFDSVISALPSLIQSICSALPALSVQLIDGFIAMIVAVCTNFSAIIQPIIDILPELIVSIVNALMSNLPSLINGAVQLVVGLVAALPQITMSLISALPTVVTSVVQGLIAAAPILIDGVNQIWNSLMAALDALFPGLSENVMNLWNTIKEHTVTVFNAIKDTLFTVWNNIKTTIETVINSIWVVIETVWNAIKDTITFVQQGISALLRGDWEGVKTAIVNVVNTIKTTIETVWNAIKTITSSVFNAIKSNISAVWDGIKTVVTSYINAVKDTVSNVWDAIKKVTTEVFDGLETKTKAVWNNIKDAIAKPIDAAKNAVKKAIDAIKDFFDFDIKWPSIPMPHFSISPSGWKVGDLLDGVIPSIGIDWYAKAMQNPMLMDEPTVFGYNAATGRLQGGGEAGSEVVSGTNTLMNMIGTVVEAKTGGQMERIAAILSALLEAIVTGNNDLLSAILAGQVIQVDGREFGRTVREYA